MLKLTRAQDHHFQALEDRKVVAQMAQFLRENEPDEHEPITEDEASALAAQCYARGREMGLYRRDKLCLFAFLTRITGGEALRSPELQQAMTEPGANPHHVVDETLNVMKIYAAAET